MQAHESRLYPYFVLFQEIFCYQQDMGQQALESYYAERATEYDQIYERPERQNDLRAVKETISACLKNRRVLEVACGTGYWTQKLARHCRSILAVDVNDSVLEIARKRLQSKRNVEIGKADAYALLGWDRTFDAGFAGFWYSHIPMQEIASFLSGFHQCLEQDAQVCFIDNQYVEGNSTPIAHVDEAGNTYQRRSLRDGSEYLILKNFPKEAELRDMLNGIGYDVHVHNFTYYWVLTYQLV